MSEAESKLVVAEPSHGEAATKAANNRGANALREAANMALEDKSVEIALALANSSVEGHVLSAKFLFLLAAGLSGLGEPQVTRKHRSMAIELSEEAQTSDELNEATREPESADQQPEG
ncbi:MAG: hypothetical protein WBM14_09235 [Terracidiphilus sp.]|jgi:hypothetical protein